MWLLRNGYKPRTWPTRISCICLTINIQNTDNWNFNSNLSCLKKVRNTAQTSAYTLYRLQYPSIYPTLLGILPQRHSPPEAKYSVRSGLSEALSTADVDVFQKVRQLKRKLYVCENDSSDQFLVAQVLQAHSKTQKQPRAMDRTMLLIEREKRTVYFLNGASYTWASSLFQTLFFFFVRDRSNLKIM